MKTFKLFNDDGSTNTPPPSRVAQKLAEVEALEHTAVNKMRLLQVSGVLGGADPISDGRLAYLYDDLEQIEKEGASK